MLILGFPCALESRNMSILTLLESLKNRLAGWIVDHLSEDDVLAIEPWAGHEGQEELWSICVWSSVGHRQQTWLGVSQLEILILEFLPEDRLASSSISVSEVSSLSHEVSDDSVEWGALVSKSLLYLNNIYSNLLCRELWNSQQSWGSRHRTTWIGFSGEPNYRNWHQRSNSWPF